MSLIDALDRASVPGGPQGSSLAGLTRQERKETKKALKEAKRQAKSGNLTLAVELAGAALRGPAGVGAFAAKQLFDRTVKGIRQQPGKSQPEKSQPAAAAEPTAAPQAVEKVRAVAQQILPQGEPKEAARAKPKSSRKTRGAAAQALINSQPGAGPKRRRGLRILLIGGGTLAAGGAAFYVVRHRRAHPAPADAPPEVEIRPLP